MSAYRLLSAAAAAIVISATAATAAEAPVTCTACDSKFVVRARATYLATKDGSDSFSALGINFADDAISVQDKWIPEIDVGYRITKHLWAELVLTIPQKHTVDLDGVGELGSFKHLPPTLLAQWHFFPDSKIDPYIGAGINLTLITDTTLGVPGTAVGLDLENYSVGPALQAGVDIALGNGFYLNFDAKWAMIRSEVNVVGSTAKLTDVQVDPLMGSIGIGYRF